MDSTRWNDFKPRDDDIIIATYGKSGTTWVQQILGQLIYNGDPSINIAERSPWLDMRVTPIDSVLAKLENQTDRRFIKTHLPLNALKFFDNCKYIYVTRDARDIVWSLYNHHYHANDDWYKLLNETPGLVGPKIEKPTNDIIQYWKEWLDNDGYPFWSFWENIKTWWDARNLPNVMLIHYSELKRDLPGEIRKIAEFINVPIDDNNFETIVQHCTFEWMKNNGSNVVPANGAFWEGGTSTFINKGVNGRWSDILPESESKRYEKIARDKLGDECTEWLMQ